MTSRQQAVIWTNDGSVYWPLNALGFDELKWMGLLPPLPQFSDPDMHHGTCVTHVPWCMPGSLTSSFLWIRWRGKRSRHSRRMRNPRFCVSGKRPMGLVQCHDIPVCHYSDVIMGPMASQITSLTIVYSTLYSSTDERKHQSSASLAFVRGIHRSLAQMASNAENVSIWWHHQDKFPIGPGNWYSSHSDVPQEYSFCCAAVGLLY